MYSNELHRQWLDMFYEPVSSGRTSKAYKYILEGLGPRQPEWIFKEDMNIPSPVYSMKLGGHLKWEDNEYSVIGDSLKALTDKIVIW